MTIGPLTIRWTKDVQAEQAEAQRLSMVRSRVIVRLRADNENMSQVLQCIMDRAASQGPKTPKGAGAVV